MANRYLSLFLLVCMTISVSAQKSLVAGPMAGSVELRDAIISEIQFQSHPDDMPTEQFKLNFTEILWTYTVQLPDLSSGGNLKAGWSLLRNRPIGDFTDAVGG